MGTKGVRKAEEDRSEIDWEEIGDKLFNELYDIITHYCFESGDPISCLHEHSKMDLYKIVDFHYFYIDITDEMDVDPLELLEEMPRDLYERLNEELIGTLKDDVESMVAEVRGECKADCGNDMECLERCYERYELPKEFWHF